MKRKLKVLCVANSPLSILDGMKQYERPVDARVLGDASAPGISTRFDSLVACSTAARTGVRQVGGGTVSRRFGAPRECKESYLAATFF